MKILVTLLIIGCVSVRASPIADSDEYQYDDPDDDQESVENEENNSAINFQVISKPETISQKVGEKVVLPCIVEPQGVTRLLFNLPLVLIIIPGYDSSLVNRYWSNGATNQALAIGNEVFDNNPDFEVDGSNLIILSLAEKHAGQYRCTVKDGEVMHTVRISADETPHTSEKIVSNSSSILSQSVSLTSLCIYLLLRQFRVTA